MLRSNWLWTALAVCALAEIGAHWYFRGRAPSEQQWRALEPVVASIHQPNDCVVVAPDWGDPLARRFLGDGIMPIAKVARASDDDCERVIEVGMLGATYHSVAGWAESERRQAGPFTLSVRRNPAWSQARYVFIDHVQPESLRVTVQSAAPASCTFTDQARQTAGGLGGDPTSPQHRYTCPGGGFHWVGVTIIDDQHYSPRRCIWAPSNRLGPLKLQFASVPLGRKLVGFAGGPWLMVRDGIGPPITLAANINDHDQSLSSRFKDTDGWVRFEWDTRAFENTSADVTLTVTGAQNTDQRFCFTLEAR
jgi:hypothetical protein